MLKARASAECSRRSVSLHEYARSVALAAGLLLPHVGEVIDRRAHACLSVAQKHYFHAVDYYRLAGFSFVAQRDMAGAPCATLAAAVFTLKEPQSAQ